MNDDFLHQLRQPPPAAFAARLRARLESQSVVRRFRGRQFTLYALIACLLGSTSLALVSPSLRQVAGTVVRQMLPQSWVEALQAHAEHLPVRYASEPAQANAYPVMRAAAPQDRRESDAPSAVVAAGSADRNGFEVRQSNSIPLSRSPSESASTPAVAVPTLTITAEGARVAGSVLSLAIAESRRFRSRLNVELRGSDSEKGLRRMCSGEIDMGLTSRPITAAEVQLCRRNGVRFLELPMAYEALAVFVNPANDWTKAVSPQGLRVLFESAAQGTDPTWSMLDPKGPIVSISLFAPRAGQGFMESFNEIVLGAQSAARTDIKLERDEVGLAAQLQRTLNGLTYLPFAYHQYTDPEDQQRRPLPVLNPGGVAVLPSRQSIVDRSYVPLSRLLFAYVRTGHSKAADVGKLIRLFQSRADKLLEKSRYVPLEREEYALANDLVLNGSAVSLDDESATPQLVSEILLRQFSPRMQELERRQLERVRASRPKP